MAAPSGAMSESNSSSSCEEEELARCREAAMPAWGFEQRSRGAEKQRADPAKNQLPTSQPSLRHKVDEHEQDGNELQTTPEFRAHVAKKLGALLDSSITISEIAKVPAKPKAQKFPPEDDGFRLFFTSLPGEPERKASPPRPRKRPPSSSSSEDSDLERQRCREAAVSASDLLQESAICRLGQVGKEAQEEEKRKKKKKLKKKAQENANIAASVVTEDEEKEPDRLNGNQPAPKVKKKKKKKKVSKAHEATPVPSAKRAPAVPTT
ncbi:protein CUSTOS [Suncus etruscus]|uniref:protein CUSTOS n=1 Tax=Suncus etruscus TaxID=109475 RepID=UPI0021102BC3|nr:protein CUSTOS [Suncus etruscus]